MPKPLIIFILTILGLTASTTAVILFAKGYRLSLLTKEIKKTGMISVKSYPEGAKVFVNGKLTTVTNNPLTSLAPGKYHLKIAKEGYAVWEKEVPVYEEMVTDIDALLISLTPKLEPLTSYGVGKIAVSSDRRKIAYTTKNGEQPGIWLISLASGSPISLFKTKSQLLLADTKKAAYSLAEDLTWSSDDSELLIKMNERGYFLVRGVNGSTQEVLPFTNPNPIYKRWEQERLKKRLSLLETITKKLDVPENTLRVSTAAATLWSPHERNFLYQKLGEEIVEYRTYNLEDPLPVGQENRDCLTLRLKADQASRSYISWYSDSRHLIIVEGDIISLIEVEGTNKTEVFAGTLRSQEVFATPSGEKLVILTSFAPNAEPNIYTLSLY